MGGVCSGGTANDNAKVRIALSFSEKLTTTKNGNKKVKEFSIPKAIELDEAPQKSHSGVPPQSPPVPLNSGTKKILPRRSLVDTDVDAVTDSGRNRISILAFEVASTITKGVTLFKSLSGENIQVLKNEIIQSEGVQLLVSTNMEDLLSIAAADKRQELDVFSREVTRFGNLCKKSKWHNLGQYFSKLDSRDFSGRQPRVEAETILQELTTLAQHTSDLYHELHSLERFEQDYHRKVEEVESLNLAGAGDSLAIYQYDLNLQKKHVRSLQKKSLWLRSMDEIVEKLVNLVFCINQAISEAFENDDKVWHGEDSNSFCSLGTASLALHYANLINQINSIASRPTTIPANMRDTLYRGLPLSTKTALRSRLQALNAKEDLTFSQVRTQMEKTFQWLLPLATNTIKAHQAFGSMGEWAKSSKNSGKVKDTPSNLIRLQTLYHADKNKTELYILELVVLLHYLIKSIRHQNHRFKPIRARSQTPKELASQSNRANFHP